jgi:hypothetical protein
MKTLSIATIAIAALTMSSLTGQAQVTYSSQNGAWANGGYSDGAGISSVMVNNDANNISYTFNTSQPIDAYPEYFILIQEVGLGGSGSTALLNSANALNGWGPSLGISTGENAYLATWNGLGGASAVTYSSGTWTQNYSAAGAVSAGGVGSSFITLTVPISSLGLSAGSQFYFDAVSSYGNPTGQAAYSALDTMTHPEETDAGSTPWNGTSAFDAATDPAGTVFGTPTSEYTITAAPEPATAALLGLGTLFAVINVRSKKR